MKISFIICLFILITANSTWGYYYQSFTSAHSSNIHQISKFMQNPVPFVHNAGGANGNNLQIPVKKTAHIAEQVRISAEKYGYLLGY